VTAGSTVIVALMGLFVFEVPAVSVIAVTIAIVVIISILSAITLLPAILGLLGPRVNWGRIRFVNRGGDNPAGRRWARLVTRRAVLAAGAGLVILVVIAIPMLSLRLGPSDVTDSPAGSTELEAGALITEGFGPGYNNPFLGVIELPDGRAADADTVQDITALLSAIEQEPDVAAVIPPSDSLSNEQVVASMFNTDKTTAVFEFVAKSGAKSERTPKLVDRTRDSVIPAAIEGTGLHVLVGGTSAAFVDLDDRIAERLAIFIGLVIVISWIILGTVFRSVAIPLTAGLLNLLVIGAAYGVLVAVFQWGWAASAFGIEQETPIVSFIAPLIFAVLFGLSMDYEVYVMSRIEEEYEAGGDPALAVRDGLGSAARMVVAAATIMFFVFAAFVLSPSIVMKMFGLGLAAAILIDAFVARMLILPAIMRLLGHAAWWPGHRAQEHRASSTAPDRTG
jgi:RND superfamily putative drug exporter